MLEKEINDKLITAIYKKIPQQTNIIDMLSSVLNIGKDSAYRRLKGSVSFSFKDVVQLALALDISVDEIINIKNSESILLDLGLLVDSDPMFVYKKKIEDNIKTLSHMRKLSPNMKAYVIYDSLLELTRLYHENIFKFYLYKWLYQMNKFDFPVPRMSDLTIPQDVMLLQDEYVSEIKQLSASTLIFDRNVYLSCIKEIGYFYKRKLISKEEVLLLAQELLETIDTMEKIATEGKSEQGTIVKLYLSSVDVRSSYSYFEIDSNTFCQLPAFSIYSLESHNAELGVVQKEWIESFKKYSVCISEASETERFEYYEKQREIVNSLMDL